jgi:hypothetical protein
LRYLITLHAASTPIQSFAAEQIAVLFKIVGWCGGLLMRDVLAILLLFVFGPWLNAQSPDPEPLSARFVARPLSLEQRQPLELVYADSIVPQDRHETMLVTGLWYMRHSRDRDALLTQKIEWGISDQLQVSTFIHVVHSSNLTGPTLIGTGDFEVGARYTWASVGSRFTHIAVALDAGFPTGDPAKRFGEGAYTVSPSLLLSHELQDGKYQMFSTTGVDLVMDHRKMEAAEVPHHALFSNAGVTVHAIHGWAAAELSVSSNRWAGGNDTQMAITPSYIWRFRRRAELLFGVPVGLTGSTDHIGGVFKLTFEAGGKAE